MEGLPRSGGKPVVNHGLDTDSEVFFYEREFYVLSNFSAFTLYWREKRFDTSEAAYHWEKFQAVPEIGYKGEESLASSIWRAPSAHEAFKIAERNRGVRRPDWDEVKVGVMKEILRAKVAQHPYVREKLLQTGDRTLIEDSWRDDFWGWGPEKNGQNQLGKLWMELREEMRRRG